MLKKNKRLINSFKIGDQVLFILNKKDEKFQLGCQAGILDRWFTFNVFSKSDHVSSYSMSDIPTNTLSLREAVKAVSIAHGQGVLKCNCEQGSCVNGKCTCKKANQKCNSRCHGGNVNENCKNA